MEWGLAMRDFGRGLLFFAGGRKGTRRSGAQRKGFAGLLPGAQGLTPKKHKILGTGSIRGETLKSFLRESSLKSCFGEHDFSQDFALPGRKSLRSAKQSPREALLLHPDPPLGLPGVGGGEEAVGLPGVGEWEKGELLKNGDLSHFWGGFCGGSGRKLAIFLGLEYDRGTHIT